MIATQMLENVVVGIIQMKENGEPLTEGQQRIYDAWLKYEEDSENEGE